MRTIREDMDRPLYEVQRWWIRIPLVILMSIPILSLSILVGLVMGFEDFVLPALRGPKSNAGNHGPA